MLAFSAFAPSERCRVKNYPDGTLRFQLVVLWSVISGLFLIGWRYERKTILRTRESRDLGNWGLAEEYTISLDNDGIMKFRR
jgi:hypothetical protein